MFLDGLAGTGRHASETNAGAEANGRAHVDIRMVTATRPFVGSGRRLCIRRDVRDQDIFGRVLCPVVDE